MTRKDLKWMMSLTKRDCLLKDLLAVLQLVVESGENAYKKIGPK